MRKARPLGFHHPLRSTRFSSRLPRHRHSQALLTLSARQALSSGPQALSLWLCALGAPSQKQEAAVRPAGGPARATGSRVVGRPSLGSPPSSPAPMSVHLSCSSDPLGVRAPAGHRPEPPADQAVPGRAVEGGPAAGTLQGLPRAPAGPGQEEGSGGHPGARQGYGRPAELSAADSQCRCALPSEQVGLAGPGGGGGGAGQAGGVSGWDWLGPGGGGGEDRQEE